MSQRHHPAVQGENGGGGRLLHRHGFFPGFGFQFTVFGGLGDFAEKEFALFIKAYLPICKQWFQGSGFQFPLTGKIFVPDPCSLATGDWKLETGKNSAVMLPGMIL